jgi:death-on-curing protein
LPTPESLTKENVLKLHNRQIERFGGTSGVRDAGLLESALAQPQATFSGQFLHSTIYEQAAAYLYHLAKNHPFLDGNKRTAFATMDTFLRLNGYRLTLTDEDSYAMVLQVVTDRLDKSAIAARLEQSIIIQ